MTINWDQVRIFLNPGATDMRKQINGLSAIVENSQEMNLFSGDLFLFCNRSKNILKALYWDKTGFCLWLKRLEKARFPWPKDHAEAKEITREELTLLLKGINFFQAHQVLNYTTLS